MSRIFQCQLCPWSFERKSDLSRHEKKHTGEKPYICETCDKRFAQSTALKIHRNTHTKKKPSICGIGTCKKAFGDPSSCTRHRRETHSKAGYKCIVADCGTKIKRRSAFKIHLRKHGIDPESVDLDATLTEDGAASHSTSPDVEDSSHHDVESRSVSPSSLKGSEYYPLSDESQGSNFVDNGGWQDDGPVDCRRADLYHANHSLLLGTMFDQTTNIDPPALPPDAYAYLSSDIQGQFYCDGIFPPTVDYSLLTASPLNIPVLEPFLEASSDGSQSSWSSPSSTYSTLCTTDLNNDMMSLSLANMSQELLLPYNTM
ncbi:hypothetical protein JVU11DRAFT_1560 [Chiua virens]|nr:hypothetical protein JVU11DRAFT_1560 [Chiua virens]